MVQDKNYWLAVLDVTVIMHDSATDTSICYMFYVITFNVTCHKLPTSGISFHKLVTIHEKRKQNYLQTIRGFCQRRQDISQAVHISCTLVFVYGQQLCKQPHIKLVGNVQNFDSFL